MPIQYLADLADIMAERPIDDEATFGSSIGDWLQRLNRDSQVVEGLEPPNGDLVEISSPAL